MTERKHSLPSRYDRLDEQVTGSVLHSIVMDPRSHGRLHMPGEYSTDSRPPAHEVMVTKHGHADLILTETTTAQDDIPGG